jgi:hypothetical protein
LPEGRIPHPAQPGLNNARQNAKEAPVSASFSFPLVFSSGLFLWSFPLSLFRPQPEFFERMRAAG